MPEILVDTQSPSVNIEKLLEEFTKETGVDANIHEIANSGHSWFAGDCTTSTEEPTSL
jgi:hypothetical protein